MSVGMLLVAAGSCGAMPFVIAPRYGIRSAVIARAIMLSRLLLLSLSIPIG